MLNFKEGGLKQAPRAWNTRIDAYFKEHGFVQCPYEHALYVKVRKDDILLLRTLYVDDLLLEITETLLKN